MKNLGRISLLLILLLSPCLAGVNSASRLQRDLRAGRITQIQRLEYEFLSHFAPHRLPEAYRGIPLAARDTRSLTPLLFQIRANLDKLDASTQELYLKISEFPPDAKRYTSESGRFLIYYSDTGSGAVPSGDADHDGTPDYVEMTAHLFDSIWTVEIDQLNYRQPVAYSPPGTPAADIGKYKIVLENLPEYYYGFTNPRGPGSYIQLRNNYDGFVVEDWQGNLINDYGADPAAGVGVTAAHEFFHAIQMTYHDNIGESNFFSWTEGTAVLMEETVFPSVNDYFQYVDGFFTIPDSSLTYEGNSDDLHGYASCVWPMFLSGRFGHEIIRRTWELAPSYPGSPYPALDAALKESGSSLGQAFAAFAEASFHTGGRSRKNDFPDAATYPYVAEADTITVTSPSQEYANKVNPLAFKYYRLLPDRIPRRKIEFSGFGADPGSAGTGWQAVAIALDSAGQSDVFTFRIDATGQGSIRIDGWDSYQTVMLAAINGNQTLQQAFRFTLSAAEYDTVRLAAGESMRTAHLDGDLVLTLRASDSVSSVLEVSFSASGPNGTPPPVFGHYYDLNLSPDAPNSLAGVDFEIRYDAARTTALNEKGLRMEELGCFLYDSASARWEYQTPVTVDSQNSVLRFTLGKVGLVGLMRRPDLVEKFVGYPSPADFRKTSRIYFPMQGEGSLSVFSLEGVLVRKLESGKPGEFDVNRFVWDGKNQRGADVKAGVYYAVASIASKTLKTKILVLR